MTCADETLSDAVDGVSFAALSRSEALGRQARCSLGTGMPRREFLYVDDNGCVHLMEAYSSAELINIGTGADITIAEFARVEAEIVGYSGKIFDTSRPDGTPRKLLDVSRLAKLGWHDDVARGWAEARIRSVSIAYVDCYNCM